MARDFEELLAEREKALAKPGANHYAPRDPVAEVPTATLLPAHSLEISARVQSAAPVE